MSDNICMRIFQKFYKWFRQESLYYRVFWAIIISISAWNILSIFVLTIKRYFSDSISIGIETTYLQWNNTFPAVSFCLTKNRSSGRVNDFVAAENIPHKVSRAIYVKNLHDYMFTNPNNFHFKEDYCDGLNSTCGVDILRLRREILPSSCQFFMANVSYLGKVVENCEDIFKFHQLEMGYCYLANNILDYKSFDNLPLKFDISNREKSLKVHLRGGFIWKYEMYVHSPDDLPYFNSITYDAFSDPTIYRFNVEEYDNNPDVKEEALQQRSCKFPNEKDPGSPWHYRTNQIQSLDVTDTLYIEISITNLPSVRYNRVVTQTYLDLVVSVGGVIGLFAGASALNFLEIVYVLLRKKV
ncbi:pickpocket 29 isoform X2 [Musca autumnalis]|uniref:pickpocket 29 isoform X2 n=1 Tax=Musca autumnalis TaxID=221902 RepID=UPI003CF265AB